MLNNLADAFTIVGNVVVLMTLTLLLKQMRDAKILSQQANAHALVESMNSFYHLLASTEGLATIYRRGRADPSSLTADEEARFFYACVTYFCAQENLYRACRIGVMPDDYFASWDLAIRDDLRDPGLLWYWHLEESFFDDHFRRYINTLVQEQAAL